MKDLAVRGQPRIKIRETFRDDRARVTDLTYTSPGRGRVPAYLVLPPGADSAPAVVFLHPHPGDRDTFLEEAIGLARKGIAGLLITSPFERPPYPELVSYSRADGVLHREAILDIRAAVDVLEMMPGIDEERLGYVGAAYGASMGGVVAGLERRVDAFVLIGSLFSRVDFWLSNASEAVSARATVAPNQFRTFLRAIAPYDATNFLHHSRADLLFQFDEDDPYVPRKWARRYYRAAGGDKHLSWYSGLDELEENARRERSEWLRRHLSTS